MIELENKGNEEEVSRGHVEEAPDAPTIMLDEHLSRRRDHRKPLFTLLALDLWCDRTYGEGRTVPLAAAGTSALFENVASGA